MRPSFLARLSSLRALQSAAYRRIWLGALVSNIGTWMETVAVGVYVTQTTGRAGATGAVAAVMYLPSVVLSPLGGALADRFDRRRYLTLLTWVQTLLASTLAVLAFSGHLSVPAVGLIAFLVGCSTTLAQPAFNALLSDIVEPEALHSALSLNSAQFNLGRITGPLLATAVLAAGGSAWAFAANALSFFAVLWAVSGVQLRHAQHAHGKLGLLHGIVEGLQHAWREPGVRLALWGTLATSVLVSPFIGLVPVFAIKVFGGGEPETGFLMTAQGVGAVAAALGVGPVVDRVGRRRLMAWGSYALGPITALYWLAPRLGLAAFGILVLGATYLVVITGAHAVIQSRVPREMVARVSSLFSMLLGGGYALGLVLMGTLSDVYGVRPVTAGCAALFFAILVAARLAWPRLFHALDAPVLHPHGAAGATPAEPSVAPLMPE